MNAAAEFDWPPRFYFNGEEMPKWSAQWHWCDLGSFLNGFHDEWDEFIGYRHIWHLQCRLDHVGIVESEDSAILRVCVQEVLLRLLRYRGAILERLRVSAGPDISPHEIFHGLIDGAARMVELAHREQRAFWISGGPSEQDLLKEFMAGCPSSSEDSAASLPPHVSQRRKELATRAKFQLQELRALAQAGELDKRFRQIVNQLPSVG